MERLWEWRGLIWMFSHDQPRRTGHWSLGIVHLVNCDQSLDAKWLDAQPWYLLSTRMCCEGLQWPNSHRSPETAEKARIA